LTLTGHYRLNLHKLYKTS